MAAFCKADKAMDLIARRSLAVNGGSMFNRQGRAMATPSIKITDGKPKRSNNLIQKHSHLETFLNISRRSLDPAFCTRPTSPFRHLRSTRCWIVTSFGVAAHEWNNIGAPRAVRCNRPRSSSCSDRTCLEIYPNCYSTMHTALDPICEISDARIYFRSYFSMKPCDGALITGNEYIPSIRSPRTGRRCTMDPLAIL
jgi:hypothetical protein